MGHHRNVHAIERRTNVGTKEVHKARVLGVSHHRHTTGQKFGSGRVDFDGALGAHAGKGNAVIGAGLFAILEFGLGDGHAKVHVPQRGGDAQVHVASLEHVKERLLRDAAGKTAHRRVLGRPVHRLAEGAKEVLKGLFVDLGQLLAQLHEVAPANRELVLLVGTLGGCKVGVVGQRRVTAHPVVVLDPSFGGDTVVVPAQGVKDVLSAHSPEARDDVALGVAKDVADVQLARDGGRRGVDAKDVLAPGVAVKAVRVLCVPASGPGGFEAVHRGLFGHRKGRWRRSVRHGWRSLEQ